MDNPNEFNQRIIDEFRANGGKVGGQFEGAPLLLLTAKGARSGKMTTSPAAYTRDGDRLVIIASKGGAPTNPAWYHNLRANPEATVEQGSEKFPVRASVAQGEERDRLFGKMAEIMPGFAEYQRNTKRRIPVVILQRLDR